MELQLFQLKPRAIYRHRNLETMAPKGLGKGSFKGSEKTSPNRAGAAGPWGCGKGYLLSLALGKGWDVQGVQDRATSALTRSKGLLLIVSSMPAGLIANFIALAQACGATMHVKDWRVTSLWRAATTGA